MLNNLNEAKQYTSEKVKGTNLIPNRSKHLWIEDHGFYISILEIQPWYGAGCFFNTGVGFLWNGISCFDYYIEDTRIYDKNTMLMHGLITYDDIKRTEKIDRLLSIAIERIIHFRCLADLDKLFNILSTTPVTKYKRDLIFVLIIKGEIEPTRKLLIQEYNGFLSILHLKKPQNILKS